MKDISQYGDGTKVMCYISVCLWGGGGKGGGSCHEITKVFLKFHESRRK